jgi:hypothetical protein
MKASDPIRLLKVPTPKHSVYVCSEQLRVLVGQNLRLVSSPPAFCLLPGIAEKLGALGEDVLVEGEEALGLAYANVEGGVSVVAAPVLAVSEKFTLDARWYILRALCGRWFDRLFVVFVARGIRVCQAQQIATFVKAPFAHRSA